MMTEITSRQRAILRSLANSIRPEQHIGKDGITPALVRSVEEALHSRELLKIRVLETAPGEVKEMGEQLTAAIKGAHLVQVLGHTVVIYRRDPDNPRLTLPG
jgi:RNA-binding protein